MIVKPGMKSATPNDVAIKMMRDGHENNAVTGFTSTKSPNLLTGYFTVVGIIHETATKEDIIQAFQDEQKRMIAAVVEIQDDPNKTVN